MRRMCESLVVSQLLAKFRLIAYELLLNWRKHPRHMFDWSHVLLNQFATPSPSSLPLFFLSLICIFNESKILHNAFAQQTSLLSNRQSNGRETPWDPRNRREREMYRTLTSNWSINMRRTRSSRCTFEEEIRVCWPTVGVALSQSTLKRKLNEISNRQELPRIGPIKPPPRSPCVYARILTANFRRWGN